MKSSKFEMARKHFTLYAHEKALACICDARKEYPEDYDMLELHAKILFSMKSYDAAEPILRQCFQRNNGNASIIDRLTTVLISKGKYSEAIEILLSYLSMDRQNHELQVRLADAYILDGQPDFAASYLEPLTIQNPNTAQYWYHLSTAYISMFQYEKAKKSALRCVEIEPRSSKAIFLLAELYYDHENEISEARNLYELLCSPEQNERLCKAIIKIDRPDYINMFCAPSSVCLFKSSTMFLLIRFALENSMFDYFEKIAEVFLRGVPSANKTITKYGADCFNRDEYLKAYYCFSVCNSFEPCNSYIVRHLGESLLKLGETEKALDAVDDFNKCNCKNVYVEYLRAKILCKQKRYSEAERTIVFCLKEDRNDYRYNSLAGYIYLYLDKLDLALEHTYCSLRQMPTGNFNAINNLALISYRRNEIDKAEKYFKLALKEDPSKNISRDNLVRVQIELGKLDEAYETACVKTRNVSQIPKVIFDILSEAIETDHMKLAQIIVNSIQKDQASETDLHRLQRIVSGDFSKADSIRHLDKHFEDDSIKRLHGIFTIDLDVVHELVNNLKQYPFVNLPTGIRKYTIPYPNAGYNGGQEGDRIIFNTVTVLTVLNDDFIITAYPSA